MGKRTPAIEKRNDEIYARRLGGETYASIGRSYEISQERVRQIVMQWERRAWWRAKHPEWIDKVAE